MVLTARKSSDVARSLGERVAGWIEQHLVVPDGARAGERLTVWPWQRSILRVIYDGDPPPRRVIISMGRKNGKTTLAAALMLAHLCGPMARQGAQIVSAAQSREQAALIYRAASRMVMASDVLRQYVRCVDSVRRMHCDALGTEYRALSADAHTAYGLSPALVIHDELGQVRGPTSDLYDALETAMAAHQRPLSLIISTQAPTDQDLLSVLIDAALDGRDPRTRCVLYSAPVDIDPWSEDAVRAANPGIGTTCQLAELLGIRDEARAIVSREPAYRNLVLNQRVQAHEVLLPRGEWEACAMEPDDDVLRAGPVWVGLDLSARQDMTAMAAVAEDADGVLHARVWCWMPEDGVEQREQRDRAPYREWARMGLVRLCRGSSIRYDDVAEVLSSILDDTPVAAIAYDRWRMDVLRAELERRGLSGLPLVAHGQGYRDMSPALDALEQVVRERRLRHGGHPVLRWGVYGARVQTDSAGNRKLDKSWYGARIDALVALVMAVGVWARSEHGQGPHVARDDDDFAAAIRSPLSLRW